MINIVVTSKPVDGLFYYSYEYCCLLNQLGVDARVVIIRHKNYTMADYITSIKFKYICSENLYFDHISPSETDITLILGRSMLTLSYINFNDYSLEQQLSLKLLFGKNLISVYSQNHPEQYLKSLIFFKPKKVIDLCDREVYPDGTGEHFEKTINFEIYTTYTENTQFKYLFLGTNPVYYKAVEKCIDQYSDHAILAYNASYVNVNNNNIFVPVNNLMGLFETYVYTKDTFDPAPRIFQECKYYGKDVIYLRDKSIVDGGSVYWKRDNKQPDVDSILRSIEKFT